MSVQTIEHNKLDTSVLSHVIKRIENADVFEQPYPHFYATEVLPWDIYNELQANMPDDSLYQFTAKRHILEDGRDTRLHLILAEEVLSRMNARQKQIWQCLYDVLQSQQLKTVVFQKLSAGLAYRFSIAKDCVNDIKAYPRAMLFREFEGYTIPAHPDSRKKIATFQLALPKDNSQQHLGTTMYKKSLHPSDLLSKPLGFSKAGQYPFIPNSVFSFSVINTLLKKSMHGREALTAEDGIRNSLLNIYYTNPQSTY
jgi:hypothetical protein